MKMTWPKKSHFLSENGVVFGQIVFVLGPALSHVGGIDPGPKLIFGPFSCRFQNVSAYPR